MKLLAVFVAVLLVSIVQLYVAGPIGLAADLNPTLVALAAYIGGMIGVAAIVWSGPGLIDKMTSFFRRLFRRPPKVDVEESEDKQPGLFARLLERFGAPFLGVVGPLTIGGWAAAVIGVSSGIDKVKLVAWLAIGQALVTAAYVYSIAAITS
ncbi:MAG: small multi-drug export protein [Acidimicrobiales bacterium]